MITRLTKTNILTAVKNLIEQYKTKTHQGGPRSCPLCQIYRVDNDCRSCPNVPFNKYGSSSLPCIRRCESYPLLNWNYNSESLVEYWTDVYKLLESKSFFEVTILHPELWKQIIEIAEKYK